MAELKTKVTKVSVAAFLAAVPNETRRKDAKIIVKMLREITGKPARMWGGSIIGFDQYHYQYSSGHEGEICMIGFSPRAQALTLYVLPGFPHEKALLRKLGKHKHGKGCLYINKLEDVDIKVLELIMCQAYAWMQQQHSSAS